MTLKDVIDRCRERIISPYLIHSPNQKKVGPIGKDNLSRNFARAREVAGIECSEERTDVTFHEQRSLAERLYRAQGIATKTLPGRPLLTDTTTPEDINGSSL